MKRHFSCFAMIVTMLLFGASSSIEGGASAELISKVAARGLDKVAVQAAAEAMEKAGLRIADEAALETVTRSLMKTSEDVAQRLGLKAGDDLIMVITKDSVASSLKTIAKTTEDLATIDSEILSKSFSTDFSKMTEVDLKSSLQSAGIVGADAQKIISKFEDSTVALAGKTSTTFESKVAENFAPVTNKLNAMMGKSAETAELKAARDGLEKATTETQRSFYAHQVADLEYKAATIGGKVLRRLGGLAGKLEGPLMMAAGTIGMAVLFMVPSIFQSSFLAQQHQNAMLQTYLPPIKFGNIVMQLPDSVVNMGNPAGSQFIYYGIPVDNPGEALSATAKAAYPGVSGPTAKNKLSAAVNNSYAQAFSVGATKKISIPRYNLDATALSTLPTFVMYADNSYTPWGSAGIPDAQFTQTMVNLNTGYILYADGTSQGNAPVGLVGPKASSGTNTIQSYMATALGTLQAAGSQSTYTEYEQAYSSAKAGKVSGPIAQQFDCSCFSDTRKNPSGLLSADALQVCSAGKSCLLTPVLNQLSAGLVLNAAGTVMTADQDLATEVAKGALGQIIPIQGMGAGLDAYLQSFPGAQQNYLANTGSLIVSLGSSDIDTAAASSSIKLQGADPDNYVAKGVYVYQCQNTPLAKILKSQSGGKLSTATSNSQITDFIVFLDGDLNQVPLMAPVQDPNNYNFITMGLNPAIKFYSTIIGNVDGNGAFSFLPQLNIQTPASLVGKGAPATITPLYGLKAGSGSYSQNLASTVSAISQALISHGKLGQQFKTIQSAMIGLLSGGPFGKYKLMPVADNMQTSIGGVHLVVYTGFNAYPASQDQANANATDVLIASSGSSTVTLPSSSVTQYYGLVTDLTYTVQPDGSLTVASTGFTNSAFNPATWAIDATKASQFYWMNKLTTMGKNADPSFTMPQPLVDFVTKARAAWIAWVQATAASGLPKAEFTGITVTGTSNVLTSVSQQAVANGLYIYNCSPCPSSKMQDYFVLTNSSAPQASDATLGTMSASKATAATNMVSLVSGIVYTSAGVPIKNAAGSGYLIDAPTLLKTIQAAFPQGLANDLKINLNISSGLAASAAMAMVYPFPFGQLQLGMYQADIDTNVYLYFDASGAGSSVNFQPEDYFVAVDSYTSPNSMGTKLSASTKYMVSLVTGQVYGPSGVLDMVSSDVSGAIMSKLSPTWRAGVVSQITALSSAATASQQSNAQQTAAMNAAPIANSGVITWPQASAAQSVSALAAQPFLADPYTMLKQDPSSGGYVIVSPATADGTQFIYTFFNVANNILDANGNSIQVAAAYDGQGNLLRVIQGIEYTSLLHQYGVGVDSNGQQYLGASNSLPIMQLDPADLALQPGVSGKSMIYSNDSNFPSHGIVSPVSYQNMQFYFYYNTIAQAYYAMQVNGSDICYIDMAGGSVYNLNGSPRMTANPVAVNSNGDMTDLLLPYLNPDSFVRCVMKNADNNNAYSDFLNSEQDFQSFATDVATNNPCGLNLMYSLDAAASSVNIAQMPFPSSLTAMPDLTVANQYNVYFDQSSTPITYMVNAQYQWQNLQLLPIDMSSRALLNPLPADQYKSASLIMQGNAMSAMIFAGQFYNNAQSSGANSYTMTSGGNSIVVSMKVDAKTNAQYVEVVASGTTYNYQCSFLSLTDSQLAAFRHNAWQAEIVADVTGNVLLEQYLSVDAAGNLQLLAVSSNSVMNMPTDPNAKTALATGLGNIQQDSTTGRFVAAVDASTYQYFAQAGYVDLENGVLFDATGLLVGYTLQYSDFIALLSNLSVSVVRDATGKAQLNYRAPVAAASVNTALSTLNSSYVPGAAQPAAPAVSAGAAATYTPTYTPQASTPSYQASTSSYQASTPSYQASSTSSYTPANVQQDTSAATPSYTSANVQPDTSASASYDNTATYNPVDPSVQQTAYQPADSSATSMSSQAAAVTQTSANVTSQLSTNSASTGSPATSASMALSTNPQIAELQLKNQRVQSDLVKRQHDLAHEKVPSRRESIQRGIKMDNDQIEADNKQIAALQATGGNRSSLLGRFSSKSKKKSVSSSKKHKKALKGMSI